MTVSPIDVIARADGFEAAAAGRALRPWEWTFIHAVDGRMQLRDVAELCGLDLAVATDIVVEQSAAGILRVVTMTLDDYRLWSGLETEDVRSTAEVAPEATADVSAAPAADVAPEFIALAREPEVLAGTAPEATAEPVVAEAEPVAHQPFGWESIAPEPIASEPIASQPLAPEPSTPEPFMPEPFAADGLSPEAFVPEAFAPEAFALEPFAPEPFAPEPFAPEPFALEPFAHELFEPEPLTSEPIASAEPARDPFDAAAAEATAAADPAPVSKGVNFSFDSFDDLDTLEPEPAKAATALAPEGISLSFEPGDQPMAAPEPFSSGGGVSLSFDADSNPLEPSGMPMAYDPAAVAPPVTALPAREEAAGPTEATGAPINLSFSSDGFPILTPVSAPEPAKPTLSAPPPAVARSASPPAPPVADRPPPAVAGPATASIDEPVDIVGSLIARVLSIRIK